MPEDAELPIGPLPEFQSRSIPPPHDKHSDGVEVPGKGERW
ncbi:MAG TPA: hypothetical protein VMU65_11510 [Candidatus Saccharimonadales bacterium]|nr:hypothetical protein [Candidatus Saccharimonadales bacterium]